MALETIYSRRSIRKYTDEQVSRHIIEQIIDAGRVALSAKNRQPWKYLVYSGEEKDKLLAVMENQDGRDKSKTSDFEASSL